MSSYEVVCTLVRGQVRSNKHTYVVHLVPIVRGKAGLHTGPFFISLFPSLIPNCHLHPSPSSPSPISYLAFILHSPPNPAKSPTVLPSQPESSFSHSYSPYVGISETPGMRKLLYSYMETAARISHY